MRIGELLLRASLVAADELARALADQRYVGKRLCSMLVARGVVGVDDVARVLAEQHGVAAALTKHFDNRDRALESLLPAHVARAHAALPLGRQRDGALVICVRDPKPHTQAALEQIVEQPVLVTTACAHVLDPLLDAAYPNLPPPPAQFAEGTHRRGVEEYDVDLSTGPIPTSYANELTFALADLDDAGVDKQFTLHTPRTPTLPTLPRSTGKK